MKALFIPSNYYSLEHCAEMSENLKDSFDTFEVVDLSKDGKIRSKSDSLNQFSKYHDLRHRGSRLLVTLKTLYFSWFRLGKGDVIIFLQANSKWQLRLIYKWTAKKCRFIYWQWAKVSVGDRISRGKVNMLSPTQLYQEIWIKSQEEKDEILEHSPGRGVHDCHVIGYLWKSKVKSIAQNRQPESVLILFNDLTAEEPEEFFRCLKELVAGLLQRNEKVILKLHPNCEARQYSFLKKQGNVEVIHDSSYEVWLDIMQRTKSVIANYTSLIYDCLLAEIPVYGLLNYKAKYIDLMKDLLGSAYFNSGEELFDELDREQVYGQRIFSKVDGLLQNLKLPRLTRSNNKSV